MLQSTDACQAQRRTACTDDRVDTVESLVLSGHVKLNMGIMSESVLNKFYSRPCKIRHQSWGVF